MTASMTREELLLRRLADAQRDCMVQNEAAAAILLQDARAAIVRLLAITDSAQTSGPVAWQILDKHGRWITLPGDWNESENIEGRQYRPLYAAPQQSPRLEREALIEECAKIAADRAVRLRAKAKAQTSPSKQSYFAQSIEARVIADAILALLSPDTTVVPSTSHCDPSQHGRHIPQTSPAPGCDSGSHSDAPMREALEKVREEIVLAIAFLGRDVGTERQSQTIHQLIARLVAADKAAILALTPVTSKTLGEGK